MCDGSDPRLLLRGGPGVVDRYPCIHLALLGQRGRRSTLASVGASPGVATEVERAADALAAAADALGAIGDGWAGGEVTRGTRAALRAWLDEGGEK